MSRLDFLALVLSGVLTACSDKEIVAVPPPTETPKVIAKQSLELIDMSKMPILSSKGRIQDGETALGETNQIAIDLVANGKDSIQFLINQLEDETEMDHKIINFWYRLYVGDMAHIILTDFFTDETEMNSTIPGLGWDEFLERGKDKDLMGEEVLRRYIRKHGRKAIKQRWQRIWNENKENIFWDEPCQCFRVSHPNK